MDTVGLAAGGGAVWRMRGGGVTFSGLDACTCSKGAFTSDTRPSLGLASNHSLSLGSVLAPCTVEAQYGGASALAAHPARLLDTCGETRSPVQAT